MSANKRPKLRFLIVLLSLLLLIIQGPFQGAGVLSIAVDRGRWLVGVENGFSIPEDIALEGEEVAIWADESALPDYDPDLYGYAFNSWTTPFGEEYNLDLLDDVYSYYATFIMPQRDVTFIANFDYIEYPGEPNITDVVGIENGLTVYWDPPYYGDDPVLYRISLDNWYDELPGDACSYTFTGLEDGATYQLYLYAVARGGVEGYSVSRTVTAGPAEVPAESQMPEETDPPPVVTEPSPVETEPYLPVDSEFSIVRSVLESVLDEHRIPSRLINRFSDDEIPGIELNPEYQRLVRLDPWFVGEEILERLRKLSEPHDVTLQLIDWMTGEYVHGGGDLYLSMENEDGTYSSEIFPNDAEHNPIVRKLKPGVRYRYGQMLPTPKGYVIPESYLFYIDLFGNVWDAMTHTRINSGEKDVVTLETEEGFEVICSVRSAAEPNQELAGVSLELEFPSLHNKIPDLNGETYWISREQPMPVTVNNEWEECTFGLNEPMPGYHMPDPIIFRRNRDGGPDDPLQIKLGDSWVSNPDRELLTLMLEPSESFPVKFSVVEQGTDQEVNDFTAFIINIYKKSMEDGWHTDDYPDGRELMLYPGKYMFCAEGDPAEYYGIKSQRFKVDMEGNVFVGDTSEGPWTEIPDKLIRLEAGRGRAVTIHTVAVNSDTADFLFPQSTDGPLNIPEVVFHLISESGITQCFTSGSEPMPLAVAPDVLYEVVAVYNPWSIQGTGSIFFKVDSSGQLYVGSEASQLYETPGSDIFLELSSNDDYNQPQTCFAAAVAYEDPATSLPGATLKLFRVVDDGDVYSEEVYGMTWKTTAEPRKLTLFPGTYYIEEIEAPSPFSLDDGNNIVQHFRLEGDGTMTLLPMGMYGDPEDRVIRIYHGAGEGVPLP
jgi:hypothetical protein